MDKSPDAGLEALRVIRHDFKTPLTSLKMLAQIFKLGLEKGTLGTEPERTERNCQMLMNQVDKLVELADSLYEISVVQSGRLQLQRQLCDLRPILNAVIAKYESKIKNVSLPDEPIWGEWDTARLQRALDYLMNEAESVEVTGELGEGQITLAINGDFRAVTDKTAPGRYISHVVIEQHGGSLEGRFVIRLPIAQKAAARA